MRGRTPSLVLLAVLTLAGCAGRDAAQTLAPGAAFDAPRARLALTTALDAWKRGKARELSRATPPVRFSDDDLAAGWRLDDYELVEPDAEIAPNRDVAVILSLRDARGRTARRETTYQVATSPGLAVLRSDP